MGVHLYTNGAWTDSGRIYRNSLNLFNATLQIGFYGDSASTYKLFTSGENYRAFTMSLPAGTYTILITADTSIKLLRVSNDIVGVVDALVVDAPFTFTLSDTTNIYATFRNEPIGSIINNIKIMLNRGSTALPYEPYNIVDWYTNTGHGYSSGAWS